MYQNVTRQLRKALLAGLFLLPVALCGCGGGYHAYPGCKVPLGYCRPAPLSYTGYCDCPTPTAVRYHAQVTAPPPVIVDP